MEAGVCKDCGEPYDLPDDHEVIDYGYCSNCPAITENVLDAPVIALRNVSEMDAD
jgi:hypothetical protein